jgi:hypothetical protein
MTKGRAELRERVVAEQTIARGSLHFASVEMTKGRAALRERVVAEQTIARGSLHCAPPDFLSRSVALINFMRFSLRKTAHVVVASSAK